VSEEQDKTKSGLNLPAEEERILAFWESEKIFRRSVDERPADNQFVFYEGPPTANGKPGIHHVLGRTFKDAIPRYQTMKGRRVVRKAGWDTHGLPVELQVEKSLGISGKPQIENLVPGDVTASITKFNQLCRESVWQYKDEWEKLTKRMGFWLDMDHPYITLEKAYIESVWWILKQIWDKGLLYEDFKVVPYCYRCGTALSSHEVATGYDEVTDRSVYVKFPVKGKEKTYLLAWTTTPWTLPGNVALAVSPVISYSTFTGENGESYIMADDLAERVLGLVGYDRTPITQQELLNLEYNPLFEVKALQSERSYRVYPADFVTTADGTGIVHTAVMYGVDDFELGNKVGLPKVHTVDLEGKFTAEVAVFAGRIVKDATTESEIIQQLQESGNLLKEESYTHTYPFCWRCSTPLIYYGKQSWFIKMSSLREQLIARNAGVRWVPEHLRDGRFGEWLREVKDWALSRDRYWGTPLPIWQCVACQHQVCIGSVAELQGLSKNAVPEDLHRPVVDEITLQCPKCSQQMTRYPEVIDVWFDSGSMPLAQYHYPFENKELIDSGEAYPADYIAEAIDQTRGWFYTLLAIATLLDRPAPYKTVVCHDLLLDKIGKKMSKSKGNIVDPMEAIAQFGIDPIRWYFCSVNQPGDTKKYDPVEIEQSVRKVFIICWNMLSFLALQETDTADRSADVEPVYASLDQWLEQRTKQVISIVTASLDSYDFFRATREIRSYITELSTWYLRLSRKRTDQQFIANFRFALRQLALLMAPFAPFFAELIWKRVKTTDDKLSVHLATWPIVEGSANEEMLISMTLVQSIVEQGRAVRSKLGIPTRQPLNALSVTLQTEIDQNQIEIIKIELNVKNVNITIGKRVDDMQLEYDIEITDELRAEGLARELTRAIQQLRKTTGLTPADTIQVSMTGDDKLLQQLAPHLAQIGKATHTTLVPSVGETKFVTTVGDLIISLKQ
jgi:isoleucyl-tRNA synthetase